MSERPLLVGGDSEIAAATLAALHRAGKPAIATMRHRDRLTAGRVFLDLAAPLDDWEPPAGVASARIFAAIGG